MKRWLIAVPAILVGTTVAALGAWHWLRPHDPLVQARSLLAEGNIRGAQIALRGAVLSHPDDAKANFMLAGVELQAGDPVAAEREARAAAAHGYDSAATTTLLAGATFKQGRFADVLRDYHPTDSMTPTEAATVLVERGLAQLSLNQRDAAATSIEEARQRDPKSFEAAMAAANLARAQRDLPAARRDVDTALLLRPDAPEALLLRADLLAMSGDRKAALAAYDTALKHGGNPIAAHLARADLLSAMGDTAQARADLDVVLKAAPQNPLANFMMARLLMGDKNWQAADAALAKAAPVLQRMPRGEFDLAIVKAELQQPQQALDAAEYYLAHAGKDDVAAARLVAQLNLRMNRPARAVTVLEPMAGSDQADVPTLELLAAAYQRTNNPQLALRSLEQAQKLAPQDSGVLTQLAAARLSLGNAQGATKDLQQALDLHSEPSAAGLSPIKTTEEQGTDHPTPQQTAAALVQTALRAGEPGKAAAALQQLRKMNGVSSAELDLLTGMVQLANVDIAGARSSFEEAMKAHPENPIPKVELAHVMAIQGDMPGAERLLSEVIDKSPANLPALAVLEGVLLSNNKLDEAIQRFVAAHQAAPSDIRLTLTLAQLYARADNPKQGLAVLASVGGVPSPALLQLRAQLQVNLHQPEDAANSLRQILAQQPNNPAVVRELAEVMVGMGKTDDASALVRNALAANPGNPLLLGSAVAVAAKQGDAAGLAMTEQLARDKSNWPAALPLKGDLLMSERHYPEAVSAYQDAAKAAPSSVLAIRLAAAQQAAAQPDAAAAGLRGWLGAHPDDAAVTEVLAGMDLVANRLGPARQELDVVLKQRPDDPAALNNLALVEQRSNNLPQARQLAQRAFLLQPTLRTADTLGWIILQQGDTGNALPLLRQAATALKSDPTVQYHYAAALGKSGQTVQAITILKDLAGRPGTFVGKTDADKLLETLNHT